MCAEKMEWRFCNGLIFRIGIYISAGIWSIKWFDCFVDGYATFEKMCMQIGLHVFLLDIFLEIWVCEIINRHLVVLNSKMFICAFGKSSHNNKIHLITALGNIALFITKNLHHAEFIFASLCSEKWYHYINISDFCLDLRRYASSF